MSHRPASKGGASNNCRSARRPFGLDASTPPDFTHCSLARETEGPDQNNRWIDERRHLGGSRTSCIAAQERRRRATRQCQLFLSKKNERVSIHIDKTCSKNLTLALVPYGRGPTEIRGEPGTKNPVVRLSGSRLHPPPSTLPSQPFSGHMRSRGGALSEQEEVGVCRGGVSSCFELLDSPSKKQGTDGDEQ